jgi:CHAT domain-containing protein
LYRDARALHTKHRTSEAKPLFERARRTFTQGRSPMAGWASLYLTVGQLERGEFVPARKVLTRIVHSSANAGYLALRARAHWVIGLVDIGAGEPAASLESYLEALSITERAQMYEDEAAVHAVLAENFRYLGQFQETWRHLLAALAATPSIRTPRRLIAILVETADACEAGGELGVSLYFRDEAIRVARAVGETVALSHALLQRSRTLGRLGNEREADALLTEARKLLDQVSDENLRQRNLADLLTVESELVSYRDPARAAAALSKALDYYGGKKNHFALSRLLLARARVDLAAGDDQRAEADLDRGIRELEAQRRRVPDESLQISYFEHSRAMFDAMIGLQSTHRNDPWRAFDYSERSRARALLDRLDSLNREQQDLVFGRTPEPLQSIEVQASLPDGTAVIEYALLNDRLLIWVLRSNALFFHAHAASASEIERRINFLRSALRQQTQTSEAADTSAFLFDLLIRPVLPDLRPADHIVFVPDKSLHAVPFAALRDRATGRYLIQDHVLGVTPSATLYLLALQRDLELNAHKPPTALVLGNPSFDRRYAPDLLDLPQALQEANDVARLLPGSELLTAKAATPGALLAAAGRHEILHFSGHALINFEAPLFSYLLLAPEGREEPGLLYAHELYGARFEQTRLAVLAACDTANGPVTGEGVLSLSRAFLAAGIPTVVASLWAVEDRASHRLLTLFYEHLRRGESAASALQQAQIALLVSVEPEFRDPGNWAAFEVLGAIKPTDSR